MKVQSENWKRELWIGDNLAIMRGMNSETVDLIYLDPPFNSKRMYEGNLDPEMEEQSFGDIWGDSDITEDDRRILQNQHPLCVKLIDILGESHGVSWQSYLSFMGIRLMEMHRLLKDTGSIYLHCDPRMSHPLKLLMDIIFGRQHDGGGNYTEFRNEIVWSYRTGGVSKKWFPRKHDLIFYYTKTKNNVFFPLRERVRYIRPFFGAKEDNDGYYADVFVRDVWDDIPAVINVSKERTGWATQKPLALLERIIKATSNEGDVVFDPFCGCATACVAAERFGRQWIGIDQHPSSGKIMKKRVADEKKNIQRRLKNDYQWGMQWRDVSIIDAQIAANLPKRTDITPFKKTAADKRMLYERQGGKCASGEFCPNGPEQKNINFMDFDRIMPGKRGGGYVWGNVQLLCSTCNGKKGRKTWKVFINGLKQAKVDQYRKELDSPDSK